MDWNSSKFCSIAQQRHRKVFKIHFCNGGRVLHGTSLTYGWWIYRHLVWIRFDPNHKDPRVQEKMTKNASLVPKLVLILRFWLKLTIFSQKWGLNLYIFARKRLITFKKYIYSNMISTMLNLGYAKSLSLKVDKAKYFRNTFLVF